MLDVILQLSSGGGGGGGGGRSKWFQFIFGWSVACTCRQTRSWCLRLLQIIDWHWSSFLHHFLFPPTCFCNKCTIVDVLCVFLVFWGPQIQFPEVIIFCPSFFCLVGQKTQFWCYISSHLHHWLCSGLWPVHVLISATVSNRFHN